ncbi:MAG: cation:proton antiporter regulatory subunit [Microthrixaceae bacterium]
MPEIQETMLPGVGVRHEFTTTGGERLALLTHRTGRRELAVYSRSDPDACRTVFHLSPEDTTALGELLGLSHVSQTVREVQQLEGVAIDWIDVPAGSPYAGSTIGDARLRSETGVSIVAIVRDGVTVAAPGPDDDLATGDTLVGVGTLDGLQHLRGLLEP